MVANKRLGIFDKISQTIYTSIYKNPFASGMAKTKQKNTRNNTNHQNPPQPNLLSKINQELSLLRENTTSLSSINAQEAQIKAQIEAQQRKIIKDRAKITEDIKKNLAQISEDRKALIDSIKDLEKKEKLSLDERNFLKNAIKCFAKEAIFHPSEADYFQLASLMKKLNLLDDKRKQMLLSLYIRPEAKRPYYEIAQFMIKLDNPNPALLLDSLGQAIYFQIPILKKEDEIKAYLLYYKTFCEYASKFPATKLAELKNAGLMLIRKWGQIEHRTSQ